MQSDLLMVAASPAAELMQMKTMDAAPNNAACFIIRPSRLRLATASISGQCRENQATNVSNRSEPVLNAP
jgi:hypothetical protein